MKSALNIKTVVATLGRLLVIEALLMLVPLCVCLIYRESDWKGFAIAALAAGCTGLTAYFASGRSLARIKMREGFLITTLIWILYGLFGLIPLMLSSHPLGFTDGMTEMISGFTTTGITMYTDVEELSHGVLFWRAFSQWLGGLGIIMFMLALLPELNKTEGIQLFNAEATGITHDKLHPRIRQTTMSLWTVYATVTLGFILLLWAGPMNLFDGICHSFSSIASGGFSTRNDGPEAWHSPYVLAIITLEMFVSGLNFMLLYGAVKHGPRQLLHNTVFRGFARWICLAFLMLVVYALATGGWNGYLDLLLNRIFLTVSAGTSTGYGIGGMESWGPFAFLTILLLMIFGACAGSTSGGIKLDRVIIMLKNLRSEIISSVYRKRVYVASLNGSMLESTQIGRISAFVALYIIVILTATGVCTFWGYPFSDSLFMVSSCIGTNGLGYGITGCEGSYAALATGVKWVLVAVMLIGRLELFTFLTLFLPSFWKHM